MSEVLLPDIESEWKKPPENGNAASLMTPLGIIGGEVLTYLEEHGATALRRLIRDLEWPAQIVMMAVGALVREGLVRAVQHDLEVILEAKPQPFHLTRGEDLRVPEAWGG